nr:uncharacterized protein LOC129049049 [Pongo abelii]
MTWRRRLGGLPRSPCCSSTSERSCVAENGVAGCGCKTQPDLMGSQGITLSLFTSGAGEGPGGESPYVRQRTVSANPQQPRPAARGRRGQLEILGGAATPSSPKPRLRPWPGRGHSQNGLLSPAALEGVGMELSQVCVQTTFGEQEAGLRPRGWGEGFCLPVLHWRMAPPSPCTSALFDSLKRLPEKTAAQLNKKLSRNQQHTFN